MTPNELYKVLNDAGLEWEVREVFEGLRVINIEVDEDPDDDEFEDDEAEGIANCWKGKGYEDVIVEKVELT